MRDGIFKKLKRLEKLASAITDITYEFNPQFVDPIDLTSHQDLDQYCCLAACDFLGKDEEGVSTIERTIKDGINFVREGLQPDEQAAVEKLNQKFSSLEDFERSFFFQIIHESFMAGWDFALEHLQEIYEGNEDPPNIAESVKNALTPPSI